jgi:hypothetical protein
VLKFLLGKQLLSIYLIQSILLAPYQVAILIQYFFVSEVSKRRLKNDIKPEARGKRRNYRSSSLYKKKRIHPPMAHTNQTEETEPVKNDKKTRLKEEHLIREPLRDAKRK